MVNSTIITVCSEYQEWKVLVLGNMKMISQCFIWSFIRVWSCRQLILNLWGYFVILNIWTGFLDCKWLFSVWMRTFFYRGQKHTRTYQSWSNHRSGLFSGKFSGNFSHRDRVLVGPAFDLFGATHRESWPHNGEQFFLMIQDNQLPWQLEPIDPDAYKRCVLLHNWHCKKYTRVCFQDTIHTDEYSFSFSHSLDHCKGWELILRIQDDTSSCHNKI